MKKLLISVVVSVFLSSSFAMDGGPILKGLTVYSGEFVPASDIKAIVYDDEKVADQIELNNNQIIYGDEVKSVFVESAAKVIKIKSKLGLTSNLQLCGGDRSGGGASSTARF
ncbi:MAG: hypothetical protein A2504_16850 [Bdellovibrionales bacterium RIFOXYD12_FULL_39_22]|nr:MAG: hypothetical protein A2385_12785 [Bdellovibrionales bacterium RIFOXYB1_FULL_39_21]OFZ42473.1 MAG: hypothetical protein A2485_04130 [Bdellovibrionales bacterium RIFOXYC12_FULL_39_17]OFZ45777.1 MAG: hypothetical protein A2404_17545 [Bdellovibrionales bacterium RIFOXYC1_FULL_39_130]OFZ74674.1 MAG: hypothetical protein A2560_08355 [Bdellovibrionales bacterium RIFOXYD1_FULL_39_84]OFZ94360.1 MAG: hypothetical protein A2504_16850 [Bdellovibrionales bacterium RIFOXYD12_FULL_39_22]HLE11348.1 hy